MSVDYYELKDAAIERIKPIVDGFLEMNPEFDVKDERYRIHKLATLVAMVSSATICEYEKLINTDSKE